MMRPERRTTVPPGMELDQAPEDELRNMVTGIVCYFGTFEVDEAKNTVIHHVEASLVPSWVGTDLRRHFRVDGSTLVLTRVSPDDRCSDCLIWDRESD